MEESALAVLCEVAHSEGWIRLRPADRSIYYAAQVGGRAIDYRTYLGFVDAFGAARSRGTVAA